MSPAADKASQCCVIAGSSKAFRLASPLGFGCTDKSPTPGFIILRMSAIALEFFGFRVIGFVPYRKKDVRLKRYRT